MATLIAYLEDPGFLDTTSGKNFTYATHDEIAYKAKQLLIRHFPTHTTPNDNERDEQDDPDEPEIIEPEELPEGAPPPKRSRSNELKDHLIKTAPKLHPLPSKSSSPLDVIKEAMSQFETSGERPSSLQKVSFPARSNSVTPTVSL